MSPRSMFVLGIIVSLAACGGGSSSPSGPPPAAPTLSAVPSPSPTPSSAVQHLYVLNNNGGKVSQYTLPLASNASPNFMAGSLGNPMYLAVDSTTGTVAEALFDTVTVYQGPLNASSMPTTFSLPLGSAITSIAFFGGKLYATLGLGTVDVLMPPFSIASTPSATIAATGSTILRGIAFDSSGTLYLSNLVGFGASPPSNLFAFAPPYSGAPVATPSVSGANYLKLVISGNLLFAAQFAGTGSIDVFQLPLTSSSAPAYSITSGVSQPNSLAVDAFGKLYVGNANETVTVYSPPFSATSTPSTTLTLDQSFFLSGVAVGP